MKRLASLLVLLTLALTGCATIPHDGAIGYGSDVRAGLTDDNLYYSPSGPSEDATPDLILSGFLNAGNGPQNDYAVGREFLTTTFAKTWKPSNEVLIQSGAPVFEVQANGSARVTISLAASVDAEGRYTEQPEGSVRVLDFKLVRSAGQWRIDQAPDLTVLIAPNFKVLFRAYSLYFFDNSLTYLVPEVRWFPSRVSTGTRLINALLAGPSSWLKNSVTSVIPAGTKLNINAVTIADSVAQVDLTSTALKLDENKRQYMKAQIASTLEQLPDVTSVEISIAQTPIKVTQFITGVPVSNNPAPAVLFAGSVKHVSTAGSQIVPGLANRLNGMGATDFALNGSQTLLAVVTATGVHRYELAAIEDASVVVDARANLLAPVFDAHGYLWTLSAEKDASFKATSLTNAITLTNYWFPNYVPIDFELSPEGTRLAVVYQTKSTTLVYVHAVTRDSLGRPVAIGAPTPLSSATGAIDVSWSDMTTVASIMPNASGATTPWLSELGGQSVALRSTENASRIVVNAAGNVFVLQVDGRVLQLTGTKWTSIANDAIALHINGH